MGSIEEIPEVDVLIVGAGFGGYMVFHRLEQLGYNVRCFEKAPSAGGIWHFNVYPGARVDSPSPIYSLHELELFKDFTFSQDYPDWKEIQRYFRHVDAKYGVSKKTTFNANVETAHFDEQRQQWLIECSDGQKTYAKYFIPCLGFASKHYAPPIKGLSDFQGKVYHTALWPQHGVNLRNKKIIIMGTGASGIQCAQEVGPVAKHLTCLIRTPNLCLPMQQRTLDPEEEERKKADGTYEKAFEETRKTFAGFTYTNIDKNGLDDTPEEREKFWDSLFELGGFRFWLNNYADLFSSREVNDLAYEYWRKRVLQRIKNPEKAKILAPAEKPHGFGLKRPSLEQRYYEVMDQDNVDIVALNDTPITGVEAGGLLTKNGLIEADVIILATGFDSVTGSLAQLDIHGKDKDGNDETIADHWKDGLRTAMGIGLAGYPNLFFLYGPQAPTAFSNGPSCTRFQAEFVEKLLKQAKEEGITRIEPTRETEEDWYNRMHEVWDATLFPTAKSWYQGSNIPGKRVEPLNWAGGMVAYVEALDNSIKDGYPGWKISKGTK